MNKNSSKIIFIIFCIILVLIVCCGISIGGYIVYKNYKDKKEDNKETELNHEIENISSSTTTTVTDEDEDNEESNDDGKIILPDLYGYIKGDLGFPSEYIPPLNICAENTLSGIPTCIETTKNQTEYTLEVTPGSYYVYSMVLTNGGGYDDYKAYYDEFVTCGMSVECTSHNPVVVNVNIGETVNNIDPKDWYDF